MNSASIAVSKTTTSFRLNSELLERLRVLAKRSNKSLNNYVETVLFDVAYHNPNEETIDTFDMLGLEKMISTSLK